MNYWDQKKQLENFEDACHTLVRNFLKDKCGSYKFYLQDRCFTTHMVDDEYIQIDIEDLRRINPGDRVRMIWSEKGKLMEGVGKVVSTTDDVAHILYDGKPWWFWEYCFIWEKL